MVFHCVPKNRQNAQRTAIPAMYRTCVFVGKRPAQRGTPVGHFAGFGEGVTRRQQQPGQV